MRHLHILRIAFALTAAASLTTTSPSIAQPKQPKGKATAAPVKKATPAPKLKKAAPKPEQKVEQKKADKKEDSAGINIPGVDKEFGDLPTYIKSNSLELNTQARKFTYAGLVEVRHGDMTLTSDFLDGNYGENNKIQELIARGNVVITKGDSIRATGARAIYDAASEMVTLTDSPELQQDKSILTADAIRIFLRDNRSVADGTVRVKMTKSVGSTDVGLKQLTGR